MAASKKSIPRKTPQKKPAKPSEDAQVETPRRVKKPAGKAAKAAVKTPAKAAKAAPKAASTKLPVKAVKEAPKAKSKASDKAIERAKAASTKLPAKAIKSVKEAPKPVKAPAKAPAKAPKKEKKAAKKPAKSKGAKRARLNAEAKALVAEVAQLFWDRDFPPHELIRALHDALLLRCLEEAGGNYALAAKRFGQSRQSVQQYVNSDVRDARWGEWRRQ